MIQELYDTIKSNRSHLSESTIQSYMTSLVNLYKKINDTQLPPSSLDILIKQYFTTQGFKKTMVYLSNKKYNIRKTLLASIIALCDKENDDQVNFCEKYRIQMLNDISEYNEEMKTQTKSESQKKNWLSQKEILDVYESLRKEVLQHKLWSKSFLTKKEYNLLQSFVILSVYVLIPPRRIADYVNMVYSDSSNQSNLNYIDFKKSELVFNQFKTKDTYKQQRVKMDKKLKSILQRWIKRKQHYKIDEDRETKYVFSRINGTPFIQPEFTSILQRIFRDRTGKSVSVNLLRHAFISDTLLKDMPALDEIEEEAEKMGTSAATAISIYKKVK